MEDIVHQLWLVVAGVAAAEGRRRLAAFLRGRKPPRVLAELARERMRAQGELGERYADALERDDLAAMRALERERKERGL